MQISSGWLNRHTFLDDLKKPQPVKKSINLPDKDKVKIHFGQMEPSDADGYDLSFVTDNNTVSRKHLALTIDQRNKKILLRDLNSTNGSELFYKKPGLNEKSYYFLGNSTKAKEAQSNRGLASIDSGLKKELDFEDEFELTMSYKGGFEFNLVNDAQSLRLEGLLPDPTSDPGLSNQEITLLEHKTPEPVFESQVFFPNKENIRVLLGSDPESAKGTVDLPLEASGEKISDQHLALTIQRTPGKVIFNNLSKDHGSQISYRKLDSNTVEQIALDPLSASNGNKRAELSLEDEFELKIGADSKYLIRNDGNVLSYELPDEKFKSIILKHNTRAKKASNAAGSTLAKNIFTVRQ